ncbi:uncharacterized protein KGF55_003641 [Candida pseudojiufengensis]|uniref:uncharacterized protein n=1 Tax=Candida pseudojiufengensis TaxID=497109 RepID=UPI0022257A3F|nr:uncharacterized protein KGF55_003641 [Candida pseudojiufengensis]KAI5962565.1 hypothetical protein KGF55_003641 [Candida pseudojiufengensis]
MENANQSLPNGETMKNGSHDSLTAIDYINNQVELEKEAKRIMPYSFDECTYEKGELRQPVFACLSCSEENDNTPIGVCYACSISCHSQHELVELFSKRSFVCDCGTTRMAKTVDGACKLRRQDHKTNSAGNAHRRRSSMISNGSTGSNSNSRNSSQVSLPADDIPSSSNVYNQNFSGKFCGCKQPYNPLEETGNMIQCFFGFQCGEDWYHDKCIMGFKPDAFKKETQSENKQYNIGENRLDQLSPPGFAAEQGDDAAETVSEEKHSAESKEEAGKTYDDNCQQEQKKRTEREEGMNEQEIYQNEEDEYDMIQKLKYFPNLDSFDSFICWNCVSKFNTIFAEFDKFLPGVIFEKLPRFENINTVEDWYNLKQKEDQQDKKRIKTESSLQDQSPPSESFSIFLQNGFKDIIERTLPKLDQTSKLAQFLNNNSYLYKDDPIYEPPEDSSEEEWSTTVSYLDMCAADAIHQLPRGKAIESIQAYDKIRLKLREFFKPFAEQGKVVTEDEVKSFFGEIKKEEKK